jgi:hypothetical protein
MSKVNFPSPFNLQLSDRHSKDRWLFKTANTPSITWLTQDQFSVVLNSEGRKIGDFDEQRDWSGGRGGERFSDDPTRYKDGREACTWINGHVIPSLQWTISKGYRDVEQSLPGSVVWRGLFDTTQYRSRTIAASASSNRTNAWIWVRRVGSPGTLTVELQSSSGGYPTGTVLKTDSETITTVDDVLSLFLGFSWTAQAVTSGTTYHLVVYGASADDEKNHWEIGGNSTASAGFYKSSQFASDGTADTWSMYYRLTDAETTRRWWYFWQGTNWCKVSNEATASLYKWNETTDLWEVVAAGTHGLAQVTGRPLEANGFVYFPQGDSVAIRVWDGTDWAAQATGSGQGCATGLCSSYSSADNKSQIVRYNNALVSGGTGTGLAVSVSRADVVAAYTTALVFRNSTRIGSTNSSINGIMPFQNSVWVFKTDEVGSWDYDRYTTLDFGMKDTPSADNGIASVSWNTYVYFNWLFSTERAFNGSVDDVGQGFRGPALPYGREGVDAAYRRYIGWMFIAKDAGTSGTSSVMLYDGLAFHEFTRGWAAGRRIRDVAIQTISGGRNRLWFDCGGDSCYIELPLNKGNPLYDTGAHYMHEFVVESSEIDMGTASKLPKFIKDMTLTSKNLDGHGKTVFFDYQLDDDIGKAGVANWVLGGKFTESPEESLSVNEGNIRKFAYRLRAFTDDNTIPPDIRGIVPTGFARSPARKIISVDCDIRNMQVNGKKQDAKDVVNWLEEAAESAYMIDVRSSYWQMDDYLCIVAPPSIYPIRAEPESDRVTFNLLVL